MPMLSGENEAEIALLKSGKFEIEFLDYDWGLNRARENSLSNIVHPRDINFGAEFLCFHMDLI